MSETSTPPISTKDSILEVISDESKLSILMGLHYFSSLNLTQIAKFTGKTKPTIYHHLKSLAENNMVELDQSAIGKSGKYYTLTTQSKTFFILNRDINSESQSLEPSKANPTIVANIMCTFALMVKNIAFFTASYLESASERTKEHPVVDPDFLMINLLLANKDQENKLDEALNNLTKVIFEISKENKDLSTVNIDDSEEFPVNHFLYFISSPISRMREHDPFRLILR